MVEGRKIGGGGKVIFDGGLRKRGSEGEGREGMLQSEVLGWEENIPEVKKTATGGEKK